jgi:hypothetical protein
MKNVHRIGPFFNRNFQTPSTKFYDLQGRAGQSGRVPPSRADLAFVVKLSAGADHPRVAGSVEHVTSGISARFEALEQLGSFMTRIIGHEQDEADPQQQDVE